MPFAGELERTLAGGTPFTLDQQRALAIAPRVTAPLSLIGSACILKSTIEEVAENTATTYHRLMLAMSFCDVLGSFWYAWSTWPIPAGTPGVWGASGNTSICAVQGFFIQISQAVPIYNGCLAMYLLLISRYRWTETRTRMVEPFMHGFSLLVGGGGALIGLPLKLYNNANLWCWYAPLPLGCKDSFRYGDESDCIRGDNAWIFRYAFKYGPIWFSLLVASLCMVMIYVTVLQQEKSIDRYQGEGISLRTQSKRVAWQSFWYLAAFYATFWSGTITRLVQTMPATRGKVYFPIIMCMSIFVPMQGFLNFFVYFRAKYLRYRRERPSSTVGEAVWKSLFGRSAAKETTRDGLTSVVGPAETQTNSKAKRNWNVLRSDEVS